MGTTPPTSRVSSPHPGQRWRSIADGHTVITGEHAPGDTFWIRYDGTYLASAIDPASFFDDYVFVEVVETSSA